MQPQSLLRGIPRRCLSQADVGNLSEGMFSGCRDYLGEPIKRLSHNHAKFAPVSLSLPLSPPPSLSIALAPSLGGVTAEDRPPRVRQAATRRERMARRAPTGICGTVQSVTPERERESELRSSHMNNGLSEKATTRRTVPSYLSNSP